MDEFDCQTCGACCIEAGPVTVDQRDTVPKYLTRSVRGMVGYASFEADEGIRCMTKHLGGRCIALRGVVGQSVACSIYNNRPFVCATFEPGSEGCLESRKSCEPQKIALSSKASRIQPESATWAMGELNDC